GFKWAFKISLVSLVRYTTFALFFTFWLGLLTGYLVILIQGYSYWSFLSGGFGYELAKLSADFLSWGTFILLGGSMLIFVIFFFDIDKLDWFSSKATDPDSDLDEDELETVSASPVKNPFKEDYEIDEDEEIEDDGSSWTIKDDELGAPIELKSESNAKPTKEEIAYDVPQLNILAPLVDRGEEKKSEEKNFSVVKPAGEEKTAEEVQNLDAYDPTLDLPHYKYPTLDL